MITAVEARRRTKLSEKAMTDLLLEAEKLIIKAAESGENRAALYITDMWGSETTGVTPKASERQESLMNMIKQYGYSVTFDKHGKSYVPMGAIDDDVYVNHVIQVRW